MGYSEWVEKHATKHAKIVKKLRAKNYTQEQIIKYFCYENMQKNEPDFCPLYAQNKKCHDMQELNCYLCACPNFRFSDRGIEKRGTKTLYSYCSIDSKDGRAGVYGEKIHQDCSNCTVPHTKTYVSAHFDDDWSAIMAPCSLQ